MFSPPMFSIGNCLKTVLIPWCEQEFSLGDYQRNAPCTGVAPYMCTRQMPLPRTCEPHQPLDLIPYPALSPLPTPNPYNRPLSNVILVGQKKGSFHIPHEWCSPSPGGASSSVGQPLRAGSPGVSDT